MNIAYLLYHTACIFLFAHSLLLSTCRITTIVKYNVKTDWKRLFLPLLFTTSLAYSEYGDYSHSHCWCSCKHAARNIFFVWAPPGLPSEQLDRMCLAASWGSIGVLRFQFEKSHTSILSNSIMKRFHSALVFHYQHCLLIVVMKAGNSCCELPVEAAHETPRGKVSREQ